MWSIMGVPGGLLLLLIFQSFSEGLSVTYVSSCDSCHDKATCRESREIGDSFTTQRHSCVCKDGFVGDGLSCYNTKLCSNSSCCSQGYHWSPNSGCVDTDECSLPNSPCIAPQVCQNTQGSFECLGPSSRTRSGRSFQSVYFNCGNTVCPLGMDCISNNGVERCADPCEYYTRLNDDWRATNNTSNQNIRCDQNVNWVGWYRIFLGQTSAQIPERCVGENKCGTHAGMWITEPNPTQSGEIVMRTVCNAWAGSCCYFTTHTIHAKLCYGNYYVYKLVRPSTCHLAYCAEVNRNSPTVLPTTPRRPPQDLTTSQPTVLPTTPRQPTQTLTTGQVQTTRTTVHPLQPSQFICDRDKLQVGLDLARLTSSGLNPFSGNLASYNCSWVRVQDGLVWYEVEATAGACGNTLRTNRTHAVYSNVLFIYPMNNTSFIIPVSLPFSCVYPLDTNTSLNVAIRPFLALAGGISGIGTKARASMSLFRYSNYTETYPAGRVTLPVGSPLYVGVSVAERDLSFAVVLEDCYATPSSNPDDSMQHPLIQNKCPIDRKKVSVIESGSSLRARFSALFFLLLNDYSDVYLHCSLSLCERRSFSCVPPCTSRSARSVSNSDRLSTLSIGPIMWDKSPE
ncbi:uromodulin [Etheostoma spectabile]|uniref:uromodulin n=1 Tax=Etheostoma spectabile TaxID=54343 RepID=UPI0013AF1E87|nr:uromodulin-like [Etheostoma spectabile]